MLILLPPSEGKTAPSSGPSLALASLLDAERLTAPRRTVMSALAEVSRGPDAASVLGLGPRSAEHKTTDNKGGNGIRTGPSGRHNDQARHQGADEPE